ncbi:glyoxylate reductase/hydroxypyruvate reductase-like isoform X2 [Lucilia sericata]|uniref:glyoxylate reductase/hydroxypyruvate reductase-like isoform X2 n=2 Tax=Lucilia sericata TaxID=13632 RepID=UPI0018A81051|nr:glyoxylate reductase/hydroxypyruvate reductase-like isoform X2 [Lucilia sericata]
MTKINLVIFTLLLGSCIVSNDASRLSRKGKMDPTPKPQSKESSESSESVEEPTFKIVVTHPEVPKEAIDLLSVCEVVVCQSLPPNQTEILEKVKGAHGIFWGGHNPLNAEVLDAAGPQLKAISTMSAGIDYVDVEELKKRKIPLGNTPVVLNNAVADVAVGLMLAAARRFHEGRNKIDSSNWENYHLEWMWGQEIRASTVGFFGFGGIGQAIAKRLSGFDIDRVLYTTRKRISKDLEKEFNASKVPFHELLAQSDFIFIAAPLTAETQGIFNTTAYAKMKKTAVLVNIARGQIVNQDDLYTALKSGQIFAAGLDVTTPEPLPADDKLLTLPNLVVTPHIGSATKRTRTDMSIIAAHNVLRGIAGEPMFSPAY